MKKRLLFLISAVALLLSAAACSIEEPEQSLRHLDFDITVTSDLGGTRAVKTGWEVGDNIYMIFDDFLCENKESNKAYYLTLTYNGSKWEGTFSDPALEQYLLGRSEGLLAASYIPFYEPQFFYNTTFGVDYAGNPPCTYFLRCSNVPYTVSGSKLSATLNLSIDTFVHFYLGNMPDADSGRYTFVCGKVMASHFGPANNHGEGPTWGSSNTMYGANIPGMPYKGGLSFSGRLHYQFNGHPADYEIKIIDNRGTDDTGDDWVYTLKKNATLSYGSAVELPPLSDPAWSLKKPKTEYFSEWGLEGTYVSYKSNERSYDWYIDQGSTGACSGVNCGPASTTMACKWSDESFSRTAEDARNEIYLNGGWWYTNNINDYFTRYGIPHFQQGYPTNSRITDEIDYGNIVLLCLDMYYITYGNVSGKRVNKFYNTNGTGWGHFLLVKGYVQTSTKLYFEVYDPYSMGRKNPDGTPMGLDRYYDASEILTSAGIWWANMIVIQPK